MRLFWLLKLSGNLSDGNYQWRAEDEDPNNKIFSEENSEGKMTD